MALPAGRRLTGMLGALLALDLLLRLAGGFGGELLFDHHDVLGWEYRPGQRALGTSGGMAQTIDESGCRLVPAPDSSAGGDDPIRVAVLGNSLTFGAGVHDRDTWPSQLARELAQIGGARPFEVRNYAVPGYSVEQMTLTHAEKVRSWRPDVVVVAIVERDGALTKPPTTEPSTALERAFERTALCAAARAAGRAFVLPMVEDPPFAPPAVERERRFWVGVRNRLHEGAVAVLGAERAESAMTGLVAILDRTWSDRNYQRLPEVLADALLQVDAGVRADGALALRQWRDFEHALSHAEWLRMKRTGSYRRTPAIWRLRGLALAELAGELAVHDAALVIARLPVPAEGPGPAHWSAFESEPWARELAQRAPANLVLRDTTPAFDALAGPLRAHISEHGLVDDPDGHGALLPPGFEGEPLLLLPHDAFHYSPEGNRIVAGAVGDAVLEALALER